MELLGQAAEITRESGVRVPWRFIAEQDRDRLRERASGAVAELLDAHPPALRGALVIPRLSGREALVLSRLASDASVAQIAKHLMVSSNTVKTQLRSVYRKLGVSSRAEAVHVAAEWGFLTIRPGSFLVTDTAESTPPHVCTRRDMPNLIGASAQLARRRIASSI